MQEDKKSNQQENQSAEHKESFLHIGNLQWLTDFSTIDIPVTGRYIVKFMQGLTISQVSKQVGLPAKTIRFYESIKLLTLPQRAENNYRLYSQTDIEILTFKKQAKSLGLDLSEVRKLV